MTTSTSRIRSPIPSATPRPSATTRTISPSSRRPIRSGTRSLPSTIIASSRRSQVTDANGNRAAAQFDELGRVVATAVMGKADDRQGRHARRSRRRRSRTISRGYATTGEPNVVHSRAREQHGAGEHALAGGVQLLRRLGPRGDAEDPGRAGARAGEGWRRRPRARCDRARWSSRASDPRWVGTGRTVFDNKGNPVKQYEPFFSSTHDVRGRDRARRVGRHRRAPLRRARPADPDRSAERDVQQGRVRSVEANDVRSERHVLLDRDTAERASGIRRGQGSIRSPIPRAGRRRWRTRTGTRPAWRTSTRWGGRS